MTYANKSPETALFRNNTHLEMTTASQFHPENQFPVHFTVAGDEIASFLKKVKEDFHIP